MGWFKSSVRRSLHAPGVPQARHVAERAVAPYLRADLSSLHQTMLELNHRLAYAEQRLEAISDEVTAISRHQPAVLNAIASTNGTTRLVRRELAAAQDGLLAVSGATTELRQAMDDVARQVQDSRLEARQEWAEAINGLADKLYANDQRVEAQLYDDIRPHVETIGWLLQRVETVRAEMMHELRYGRAASSSDLDVEIVEPSGLSADRVRLNLGCGHLPIDGFVNVDMRKLPGVDIVAPIDSLPVEPETIDEIFSAHVLEHFPQAELERKLLPYWFGLLKPAGEFRAVVPDVEAMIDQLQRGDIEFEAFRAVAYGGQEYEGDFHFTAFTPESLGDLLRAAGFENVNLVQRARPNADCLEFEITARRPA